MSAPQPFEEHDSDEDINQGAQQPGVPGAKAAPVYNDYIDNDFERAKFFNSRIKTIRAKTETFAKCTGEEVLVIAIDEGGSAHHWGTKAFEKFVQNPKVQELIFKHITEQPAAQTVLQDTAVEEQHLRSLLRQKFLTKQLTFDDPAKRPEEWPETVPFAEPMHLTHEQLLMVLKSFYRKEHGLKRPGDTLEPPAKRLATDPSGNVVEQWSGDGAAAIPNMAMGDAGGQSVYSMINAVKLLQQGVAAPSLGASLAPGHQVHQQPMPVRPPAQRLMGWVGRGPPPAQPNPERLQPSFMQQQQQVASVDPTAMLHAQVAAQAVQAPVQVAVTQP